MANNLDKNSKSEPIEGKLSFNGSKNLNVSDTLNMGQAVANERSVTKKIKPGQLKFFAHC